MRSESGEVIKLTKRGSKPLSKHVQIFLNKMSITLKSIAQLVHFVHIVVIIMNLSLKGLLWLF